jgi:hypothetical protein
MARETSPRIAKNKTSPEKVEVGQSYLVNWFGYYIVLAAQITDRGPEFSFGLHSAPPKQVTPIYKFHA